MWCFVQVSQGLILRSLRLLPVVPKPPTGHLRVKESAHTSGVCSAAAAPAVVPDCVALFIIPPFFQVRPGRSMEATSGGRGGCTSPRFLIANYWTLWHLRHIPRLSIFSRLARCVSLVGLVTLPSGHGTVDEYVPGMLELLPCEA